MILHVITIEGRMGGAERSMYYVSNGDGLGARGTEMENVATFGFVTWWGFTPAMKLTSGSGKELVSQATYPNTKVERVWSPFYSAVYNYHKHGFAHMYSLFIVPAKPDPMLQTTRPTLPRRGRLQRGGIGTHYM